MKRKLLLFIIFVFFNLFSNHYVLSQPSSGGSFTITKTVIATGGETSANGDFSLIGTIGQSVTDGSSMSPFILKSGFWNAPPLTPTAASASISGRVLTSNGSQGIPNEIVQLTLQNGEVFAVRTNQFGYYRFNNVIVGQVVILNIFSKQYFFNTAVLNLENNISDLNFIAL